MARQFEQQGKIKCVSDDLTAINAIARQAMQVLRVIVDDVVMTAIELRALGRHTPCLSTTPLRYSLVDKQGQDDEAS